MKSPLRVLHLEDDPNDAELVQSKLEAEGIACEVTRVETRAEYLAALEQSEFDLILTDYALSAYDGLSALRAAREKWPDIPFIIVSGTLGEELAIETLREGVTDYVLKHRLTRLAPAVRRAIYEAEKHSELKRAAEALRQSEKRFRALIENSSDGIVLSSADGNSLYISPSASRILGYAREELAGTGIRLDLVHPDDVERTLAVMAELLQNPGKVVTAQYRFRHKDGSWRWLEIVSTNQLGEPSVQAIVVNFRDVTQRKLAEEQIRKLFRAIEQSSNVVMITDTRGNIEYVNPKFTQVTGYTPEEIIATNSRDLGEMDPAQAKLLASALEAGGEWRGEFLNAKKNGERYWEAASISVIRDEHGAVTHYLKVAEDVTERKRVEEALRLSSEILQRVNALILVADSEGQIIYASPSCKIILGYAPDELLGDQWWTLSRSDPVEREREQTYVARAAKGEAPVSEIPYERLVRRRDGEARWIVWQDAKGPSNLLIGVGHDVTERKRAEEALARERDLLHALMDNIPDTIYFKDTASRFTRANRSQAQVLGLDDPAEAVGKTDFDFRPAELARVFFAEEQEVIQTGQPVIGRIEFNPTADGQARWFSATKVPIQDTDGRVTGIVGISRNITERIQAEEALRFRLALDNLIATISTSFIYLTPDEIDTGISRALEAVGAFVGVDRSYVFRFADDGRHMDNTHEWCAPGVEPRLARLKAIPTQAVAWWIEQLNHFEPIHVARVADLPAETGAQVERLRAQGVQSLLIVPMAFGRALVGFLGFDSVRAEKTWSEEDIRLLKLIGDIFVNALVRRQAQMALEQERALLAQRVAERTADLSAANAALARAVRLKDEFLASMSHELRTPLNAILGLSEALQEQVYGPLNPDQLKTLHTIAESGRHLLNLINDILDLSKIEAGKLELQIDTVFVESVCQASLRLIREAANKKRLKVHSTLDSTVATLQADERRLTQILVNLLSNAVKFTPDGGSIGLEAAGDDEHAGVRFTVWDTGIGIAEEDMSRLFQPFVQLDSSLARQHSGTGLGLSLVYRMVDMHGGSIRVESQAGAGSRFSVLLPSRRPAEAAELVAGTPAEAPAIVAIRRALVVEDSPAAAGQLVRYLAELGAQATLHAVEEGVVDKALEIQPDVILLDILLPNPVGWDVLARLKAEPRTRHIQVVIVSVVDDAARGQALGAADFLVKPVSRQQLRSALSRLRPPAERAAPPAPALDRPPHEQPLILLAEDNENNILTLSGYLQVKGYRLVVARNGGEAIERATEEKPALILMGVQMPGMDGLEATRHIRADRALGNIPIVALTALAMPGDRERCLQAGANDYLSKPVSLKQLAETIEAHRRRQ